MLLKSVLDERDWNWPGGYISGIELCRLLGLVQYKAVKAQRAIWVC